MNQLEQRKDYKQYLGSPHWQSIRQEVLERDGSSCVLCESKHGVCVHHLTYDRKGAELLDDLVCLCAICHDKEHSLNGTHLWQKKYIKPGDTIYYRIGKKKCQTAKVTSLAGYSACIQSDCNSSDNVQGLPTRIPYGAIYRVGTRDGCMERYVDAESFYYFLGDDGDYIRYGLPYKRTINAILEWDDEPWSSFDFNCRWKFFQGTVTNFWPDIDTDLESWTFIRPFYRPFGTAFADSMIFILRTNLDKTLALSMMPFGTSEKAEILITSERVGL